MVYLKMGVGLLFPLNFQTNAISRSLDHVPISTSQNLHKKGTVHCQGWPLTFSGTLCRAPQLGFEGVIRGHFAHLFLRLLKIGRLNLRQPAANHHNYGIRTSCKTLHMVNI